MKLGNKHKEKNDTATIIKKEDVCLLILHVSYVFMVVKSSLEKTSEICIVAEYVTGRLYAKSGRGFPLALGDGEASEDTRGGAKETGDDDDDHKDDGFLRCQMMTR